MSPEPTAGTRGAAPTRAAGARARAKLEMRGEILAAARRALAHEGPSGLSLRAVARDVGLVSSAVYRYFPSREALLTTLIVESYDALGDAVDAAEAAVPRALVASRFRAVARAARAWGHAEPQQWSLIFGSPIPGYDAPTDTVGAATRVPLVLAGILEDAHRAGTVAPAARLLPDVHDALEMRAVFAADVPDQLLVRGLVGLTYVLGGITLELFGHRHRVVGRAGADAVFEHELDEIVRVVGFVDPTGGDPAPSGM